LIELFTQKICTIIFLYLSSKIFLKFDKLPRIDLSKKPHKSY
jgi:hypothetical protein